MTWLKDARIKAGLTQDDVAKKAAIVRGSYANIENGERRPSVDIAKRIAAALGFEWTKFFEEGS